jgi:hypothetical protein
LDNCNLHTGELFWIDSLNLNETYLYNITVTSFRRPFTKKGTTKPVKEIQKMKETTQEPSLKPVLHGFLLNSGKFITPAKMEIMESFGVVRTKKSEFPK